jgi:hypothetical protein
MNLMSPLVVVVKVSCFEAASESDRRDETTRCADRRRHIPVRVPAHGIDGGNNASVLATRSMQAARSDMRADYDGRAVAAAVDRIS